MAVDPEPARPAVAEGEIAPVDTAALAHVLGRLGREFARPEVAEMARPRRSRRPMRSQTSSCAGSWQSASLVLFREALDSSERKGRKPKMGQWMDGFLEKMAVNNRENLEGEGRTVSPSSTNWAS